MARIKGQEVEILVIQNGAPVRSITAVQSFEITPLLEILSEGYLGETTERKDEIYKGVNGSMDIHLDSADAFLLEKAVVDRARRRQAGTKINIKATLRFPSGERVRVLIPNVAVASPSTRAGGRAEYVTKHYEFSAEDYHVI